MATMLGSWVLQNSVVVLAALPLVWVYGRMRPGRPAECSLLWLLLLVKLITPPLVGWRVPIIDLRVVNFWSSFGDGGPATAVIPRDEIIPVPDSCLVENGEGHGSPDVAQLRVESEAWTGAVDWNALRVKEGSGVVGPVVEESVPVVGESKRTGVGWTGAQWLSAVWVVGSALVLGWVGVGVWRQVLLLKATCEPSDRLLLFASIQCERMGIRRLRLRTSGDVATPFVSCLGLSVVVWPRELELASDLERMGPVLAHELAHLRRRDHWVAWVEVVSLVGLWWNPLVWLIRSRLHETRELACDAMALESAPGGRRAFAELLVNLTTDSVSGRRVGSVPPLRTAWAGSRQALRRRLTMIFDERVRGRVSGSGWCVAGMSAVLFLPAWSLVGPQEAGDVVSQEVRAATPSAVAGTVAADVVVADPAVEVFGVARATASADTPTALPFGQPNELLQTLNLGEDEGVMKIYRVRPGVVRIEIEKDGRKVVSQVGTEAGNVVSTSTSSSGSAMSMSSGIQTPTISGSVGSSTPRPSIAAASPRVSVSTAGGVTTSADGRSVQFTKPDGIAQVVTRVAPSVSGSPAQDLSPRATQPGDASGPVLASYPEPGPALSPASEPFMGGSPKRDIGELEEERELAQLTVEEKEAELELAQIQAGKQSDPLTNHKVKIAELEVRRAKIALRRASREFEKALIETKGR